MTRPYWIAVLISCLWLTFPASAAETITLRTQRHQQQQARETATRLVRSVLDVQLRQLAENGLQDMPLYRDIDQMRNGVTRLVDEEMPQVVRLLNDVISQPGADPSAATSQAHALAAKILGQLVEQREKLRRRMLMAQLANQLRSVLENETLVQTETAQLPQQSEAQREQAALRLTRDQRSLASEFEKIRQSLEDAAAGQDRAGDVAQQALDEGKQGDVGRQMNQAADQLANNQVNAATESQLAAISGLQAMLNRIEQAFAASSGSQQSMQLMIGNLATQQGQLRESTAATDGDLEELSNLIQQQTDISKQIEEMLKTLEHDADYQKQLQQAQEAAMQAAEKMFEGQTEAAQNEQGEVIDQLRNAQSQLAQQDPDNKDQQQTDGAGQQNDAQSGDDAKRAQAGKSSQNEQGQQSDSENTGDSGARMINDAGEKRGADATLAERVFAEQPWFLMLPPATRQAIQSKSRRAAPRGYQQRMQRYFKSID